MAVLENNLMTNVNRVNNKISAQTNRLDISDRELANIDKEYCTYGDKICAV